MHISPMFSGAGYKPTTPVMYKVLVQQGNDKPKTVYRFEKDLEHKHGKANADAILDKIDAFRHDYLSAHNKREFTDSIPADQPTYVFKSQKAIQPFYRKAKKAVEREFAGDSQVNQEIAQTDIAKAMAKDKGFSKTSASLIAATLAAKLRGEITQLPNTAKEIFMQGFMTPSLDEKKRVTTEATLIAGLKLILPPENRRFMIFKFDDNNNFLGVSLKKRRHK